MLNGYTAGIDFVIPEGLSAEANVLWTTVFMYIYTYAMWQLLWANQVSAVAFFVCVKSVELYKTIILQ